MKSRHRPTKDKRPLAEPRSTKSISPPSVDHDYFVDFAHGPHPRGLPTYSQSPPPYSSYLPPHPSRYLTDTPKPSWTHRSRWAEQSSTPKHPIPAKSLHRRPWRSFRGRFVGRRRGFGRVGRVVSNREGKGLGFEVGVIRWRVRARGCGQSEHG